jgi:hypothetical protein
MLRRDTSRFLLAEFLTSTSDTTVLLCHPRGLLMGVCTAIAGPASSPPLANVPASLGPMGSTSPGPLSNWAMDSWRHGSHMANRSSMRRVRCGISTPRAESGNGSHRPYRIGDA